LLEILNSVRIHVHTSTGKAETVKSLGDHVVECQLCSQ